MFAVQTASTVSFGPHKKSNTLRTRAIAAGGHGFTVLCKRFFHCAVTVLAKRSKCSTGMT